MKYKRIRDLREDKDLTQTEIAKILNITQRTYSRYENDERQIPTEILFSGRFSSYKRRLSDRKN